MKQKNQRTKMIIKNWGRGESEILKKDEISTFLEG